MNEFEWKQYYTGMVARGSMKPEKEAEMVKNCGGLKRVIVPYWSPELGTPEPKEWHNKKFSDSSGLEAIVDREEDFDEAVERIKGEIMEQASRASLERRADQIIAEIRRR